jgi:DNA mismatch endonuclease, patch repair protein
MADVHTTAQRSYNMSRIKGKNTRPEMLVRRFLHAHGFRYRLHEKKLPGKPDMVLPKYRTVIFVDLAFGYLLSFICVALLYYCNSYEQFTFVV